MSKLLLLFFLIGIIGCAGMTATNDGLELVGKWQVEALGGRPVIDRSLAYIQFSEDGKVGGNSSCNQFTGNYEWSGSKLSFGQAATTRKMCPAALMDQEKIFLKALAEVVKVEMRKELLVLLDAAGNELISASRRE